MSKAPPIPKDQRAGGRTRLDAERVLRVRGADPREHPASAAGREANLRQNLGAARHLQDR